MSRRYQKVQELRPQIRQMLEQGMSQREVAESLGLKGDRPVHDSLKWEQKKEIREYANNVDESQPGH